MVASSEPYPHALTMANQQISCTGGHLEPFSPNRCQVQKRKRYSNPGPLLDLHSTTPASVFTPPTSPYLDDILHDIRTPHCTSGSATSPSDLTLINRIPNEVLLQILLFLPIRTVYTCAVLVCKQWRSITVLAASTPRFQTAIRFEKYHTNSVQPTRLTGHTDWVTSLATSQDRKWLYSGSVDQSIRVWLRTDENGTGSRPSTTTTHSHTILGHTGTVWALVHAPPTPAHSDTDPDGHEGSLFSGSDDHTVRVWNLTDFSETHCLTGHTNSVMSLAHSTAPNGKLYSGSHDSTIRVWSKRNNFEHVTTLEGHLHGVMTLEFSEKKNLLFSGSRDATVMVWSGADHICLQTLQGHTRCVRSLALSTNHDCLYSGSNDKTIRLWSSDTVTPTTTSDAPDAETDGDCATSLSSSCQCNDCRCHSHRPYQHPDAIVSVSTTLPKADPTNTYYHDRSLAGYKEDVCALATLRNTLVSSYSNIIRVWSQDDDTHTQTLAGHSNWILALTFSSDGCLFSGSVDHTILVW